MPNMDALLSLWPLWVALATFFLGLTTGWWLYKWALFGNAKAGDEIHICGDYYKLIHWDRAAQFEAEMRARGTIAEQSWK